MAGIAVCGKLFAAHCGRARLRTDLFLLGAPPLERLLFLQSLLGLALLLLSRQFSPLRFAGAYLLFYTVLSVSNIQEQTLLNGLSDSSNRATVLSLASLACQLGNLALHAASGALVLPLGASGLWGLSGLLLLLVCGGSALLYRSGRRWPSSDTLL